MKSSTFESMSLDELWGLHEQVTAILALKLEDRQHSIQKISIARPRRPYPKVLPKYQNPKNPAETWAGRGRQPHWVREQLKAGKKLEHFLIARSSTKRRHR